MGNDVFISYRWGKNSQQDTLKFVEDLRGRLRDIDVYVDISARKVGDVILERIQDEIRGARVMIIVVHPDWVEQVTRLHDPNDLVRMEIEVALSQGIKILPVFLSDAPDLQVDELPDSIQSIVGLQAFRLPPGDRYSSDLDLLATYIKYSMPALPQRLLERLSSTSSINLAFGAIILGGLLLFLSRILEVHTFYFPVEIEMRIGDMQNISDIEREGGVLLALNWVIVLLLITPIMIVLFSQLLRQARKFIEEIHVKQMVQYVGRGGLTTPTTFRQLWDAIAIPSSKWFIAFFVMAIVLGTVQWWQYSGQWYWGEYSPRAFLGVSTGVDWHVGWELGVPNLKDSGLAITLFALGMYLVYGISSAITFSFYAFMFNLVSHLANLATIAGVGSEKMLRLDVRDRETGGLAALESIQAHHASFCYWSLAAMYLMSLRNAYLPPMCKLPAVPLSGDPNPSLYCSNMIDFMALILKSLWHFVQSLFAGSPDFSILFFNYSNYNVFILGSLLHVILIASFFYLVSARMLFVIESARLATRASTADALGGVGDPLVKAIRRENAAVIIVLLGGALSIVFLNLGPLLLIIVAVFYGSAGIRRKMREATF